MTKHHASTPQTAGTAPRNGGDGQKLSTDAVNLSTVYADVPLLDRPRRAARDGYRLAESWWEFGPGSIRNAPVEKFVDSLKSANIALVALNAYAGDREHTERGLASLPDRQDEFQDSIRNLLTVARLTGTRRFNVTFGCRDERWEESQQLQTGARALRWAAEQVQDIGGVILVEPLAEGENGTYPFKTGYDIAAYLQNYLPDVPNIGLLFDTYHLAANGINILTGWSDLQTRALHVQIADFPGRGKPGSGTLPIGDLRSRIRETGYEGYIALEYLNTTPE